MTFQKNTLAYIALGASILSLGACSHPNSMPSGYTYHHEDYKSPVSPTSRKITVEQRKYMDAAQAEQFRDSVYDLLERVTMRAGMPPKPVYILAPDPMTTFYANIDNDLRESMRHIGYAISDTPNDAYVFTYEALPIEKVTDQPISAGANNVHLTLRVFDSLSENARQLTEESGQYFIQGAENLSIVSSHYGLLPSKTTVANHQANVTEPQYIEPVAIPSVPDPVPPMIEPVQNISVDPMMPVPMQKIPTEPLFSEIEQEVEITPIVEEVVKAPKISKPIIRKSKKPSRDDIVIINRGDKPIMGVTVESEIPMVDVPKSEDTLQKAIPDAKDIVRGRVSAPADY